MALSFGGSQGAWRGTNGFRLMPTDTLHDAPASAHLSTAAGGHTLLVAYTWAHPTDGEQDGVLLIGSPDTEQHRVTAAWGDSWHQQPAILVLAGVLADGGLEVSADYGGGWRWVISLDQTRDDTLRLTMHNVIPDHHATEQTPAGPYVVMHSELRRLG